MIRIGIGIGETGNQPATLEGLVAQAQHAAAAERTRRLLVELAARS